MLEKESSRGGYTSDSETSSTGGERNTDMRDKQEESPSTGRYRSTVYIENNGAGAGVEDPKMVSGEKSGGYTSDSEASTTATETNVGCPFLGAKKVCRRERVERSSIIIYFCLQPVTILDMRYDSGMSDNLHLGSDKSSTGCTKGRCLGSKVR